MPDSFSQVQSNLASGVAAVRGYDTSTTSTASISDWRNSTTPSDLLFALDSYWSKDDFTGRAAIYEDENTVQALNIDLVITNVDLTLDEHIQISEYVGDNFGIVCFGKAPLQVTFTATLPDTQLTYGKQYLVDAYKNKLRLSAVARTGKIPVVQFATHYIQGPFISLRITESSQSEDTFVVIMTMIVTQLKVM